MICTLLNALWWASIRESHPSEIKIKNRNQLAKKLV